MKAAATIACVFVLTCSSAFSDVVPGGSECPQNLTFGPLGVFVAEPGYSRELDCERDDFGLCQTMDWLVAQAGEITTTTISRACPPDAKSSECNDLHDFMRSMIAQAAYEARKDNDGICTDCNECEDPLCCCWEEVLCMVVFRCGYSVTAYYCSCDQVPGIWYCGWHGPIANECQMHCYYCGA